MLVISTMWSCTLFLICFYYFESKSKNYENFTNCIKKDKKAVFFKNYIFYIVNTHIRLCVFNFIIFKKFKFFPFSTKKNKFLKIFLYLAIFFIFLHTNNTRIMLYIFHKNIFSHMALNFFWSKKEKIKISQKFWNLAHIV